ncbi:MAG: hypothetical protein LBU45_04645 [Azoarcus sp.]|jgi:hypothetical protein|nr:hypothetical protein [Azoarcus sp.]
MDSSLKFETNFQDMLRHCERKAGTPFEENKFIPHVVSGASSLSPNLSRKRAKGAIFFANLNAIH